MAKSINRRSWLKYSSLMGGGLLFFKGPGGKLGSISPAPPLTRQPPAVADQAILADAPPTLKLRARLFANENPFGPSPAAKKAMADALDTSYQYPIQQITDLQDKIAAYEGVPADNVMLNSGSSPLLVAAALHYSKGGKSIVTGDPSYEDLASHAQLHGANWVKVPLTKEYQLDLDAMEARVDANTGLVYICNPNNPTGTVVDAGKLKAFCDRVSQKTVVFVDEAYIDYLPDPQGTTLTGAVKAGKNIIVARTFSKVYGFAGNRCGYIVAQPETVKTLATYTSVYNISAVTLSGALAAYRDTEFMADAIKKTIASKDYLYETLKKEGYEYIPSVTNFVLFPIKMDGKQFVDEMMKRGVAVKNWKFNNKDWCRVSIGRMDEMQAFADAFKQIS